MKIIFVCTGNTCRSPMAEAYFRSRCQTNDKLKQIVIDSAGLAAGTGAMASETAIKVMAEQKIDLTKFRSTSFKSYHSNYDFIIPMCQSHQRLIVNYFPETADRTRLLMSFVPGTSFASDVSDPFGGSLIDYRRCFEQMKHGLDGLYDFILKEIDNFQ